MTPAEVAVLFKTTAKSITRLSEPSGDRPPIFHATRTPGGHRRYDAAEVERIRAYLDGRPLTRNYTRRAPR